MHKRTCPEHSAPNGASREQNAPDGVSPAVAGGTIATEAEDSHAATASRRMEVTVAAVALAVGAAIIVLAYGIEVRTEQPGVGPRSWPKLLGFVTFGLSLILLVTSLVRPPLERDDLQVSNAAGWQRLAATVAVAVAFIIVWPLTDFRLATPVFLAAVTALFGGRGWRALIVFPALMTGFIYILFGIALRIPL